MSNSFKEVDMKQHVKYHEVIFNQNIPLNPCIGCIYRGSCEGEQYVSPGEFCSRKETNHAR